MYDSVGQFYPWRKFAAEMIHSGTLPLWNPYQFCGTPFVANSQSAVFYPGNLLHYLLPTAYAMGWTAILHLILAATFMWLFLRHLGLKEGAGALGAIVYAFSTWQVSWLHLPTFLNTSCWLPLVLLLALRLFQAPGWQRAVGLGFAVGMTLLAGHLQIAFYVLLAAGLLAVWLAVGQLRTRSGRTVAALGLFFCSLFLGGMLSAPQLIPILELSRMSHRVAQPTSAGYEGYVSYAVGAHALVTLFMPDFYGNPSNPDTPYVGTSRNPKMLFNYAEGALYVGLPTLLLAGVALRRLRQSRLGSYLVSLGLIALLMALGTVVDALFYFYVPGFGQSGSPGRALVLWGFALSALAAMGYERLTDETGQVQRHLLLVCAGIVAVFAVTYWLGMGSPLRSENLQPHITRQAALLLGAGLLLFLVSRNQNTKWVAALPVALVAVDLFANGINYNKTASLSEVYPDTALIGLLKQTAGHDRIAPVNHGWSFFGPKAVLPPNGAMVYGLRDVQGYDSLFPGQYKAFMNRFSGQARDASPQEVGNMVFSKSPERELAQTAGVRWMMSLNEMPELGSPTAVEDGVYLYEFRSENQRARIEGGTFSWQEDVATRVTLQVTAPTQRTLVLADQFYPGWKADVDGSVAEIRRADDVFREVTMPAGQHTVHFRYEPMAFRFGLFLALVAIAGGTAVVGCKLALGGGRRAVSTV